MDDDEENLTSREREREREREKKMSVITAKRAPGCRERTARCTDGDVTARDEAQERVVLGKKIP